MKTDSAQVAYLYKRGHTYQAIADRFGVTKQRIEQICRDMNLPYRRGADPPWRSKVMGLHLVRGLDYETIGKRVGVSGATVRFWLKRWGAFEHPAHREFVRLRMRHANLTRTKQKPRKLRRLSDRQLNAGTLAEIAHRYGISEQSVHRERLRRGFVRETRIRLLQDAATEDLIAGTMEEVARGFGVSVQTVIYELLRRGNPQRRIGQIQ